MYRLDFKSLVSFVSENRDTRVMLTFHSIGDADSAASSIVLSKAFRNSEVVTPDAVTASTMRIINKVGYSADVISKDFMEDAQLIVMLDVNNFYDCGAFEPRLSGFNGDILIIDHHAETDVSNSNVHAFNDESYNSASSIVLDLLKALGVAISPDDAKLLAIGIISDSAELRNADARTFAQIGELLKMSNASYQSILGNIEATPSPEIRARTINDLFKSSISIEGDLLVMYGRAHQHANIAGDDAIKIGADIAIFYAENEGRITFSARMRQGLDKELGVHLGELMKRLAYIISGTGGGHPCAAGAYGTRTGMAQEFINSMMENILKNRGGG